MKQLFINLSGKEMTCFLLSLSPKHRLYCAYFCISLCSLCISDDSPLWVIALVVINLANAVRLLKRVPVINMEE